MATIQAQRTTERRILLHDVRWQTYEMLLADLTESHVRLAYDRGELELWSPSREHETYKCLIARMIEALTEELDIPLSSGGSTTFRREDLDRGLEPDECYWIEQESAVRGKLKLDLSIEPPPDLVIEIDISRSSLNRRGIYGALGVPEIWAYNGHSIQVFQLSKQGSYVLSATSRAFPYLPMAELVRFLQQGMPEGETRWIKAFRAWVRTEIVSRAKGPGNQ